MYFIACYATCWACKFDQCYDAPTPHPWWGQEDVEFAVEAGLPVPEGNCACPCGKEA